MTKIRAKVAEWYQLPANPAARSKRVKELLEKNRYHCPPEDLKVLPESGILPLIDQISTKRNPDEPPLPTPGPHERPVPRLL